MPLFEGSVTALGVTFPFANIAVILIGTATIAIFLYIFSRTSLGIDMQAIACNPTLAQLRGISVQSTLCAAWVMGTLLAALSGVLLASVSVVSLEGSAIAVNAIVAALIGGLTSIPFAIVGAFLLAGSETMVTLVGEPRYAQVIPVLGLLLLLIVRPTGLASRSEQVERV